MQNEQQHKAPEELQKLCEFYRTLYDNAPLGYVILRSRDNMVLEVNFTAAGLLGMECSHIRKTRFTRYIMTEFTGDFHLHRRKALKSLNKENIEVKMRRGDDSSFWAELEMVLLPESQNLCIAILDITRRKESEAELDEYRRSLEMRVEDGIKKRRALALQLMFAQEEERRKLGRELHNNVAQSLTLLAMFINRLRKLPYQKISSMLDEMEMLAREAVQQVRHVSRALDIQILEDMGLLEALRNHFQEVQTLAAVKINFHDQMLQQRLPGAMEIILYRIIQEIISYIIRHDKTDELDISIEAIDRVLYLRIEDKGETGFTLDLTCPDSTDARGIQGHAALLGGRLSVESRGDGGRIIGEFPFPLSTL